MNSIDDIRKHFSSLKKRDITRILPICLELADIWRKHPDLRLGQLIMNLGDIYNIEDDKLISILREKYK